MIVVGVEKLAGPPPAFLRLFFCKILQRRLYHIYKMKWLMSGE